MRNGDYFFLFCKNRPTKPMSTSKNCRSTVRDTFMGITSFGFLRRRQKCLPRRYGGANRLTVLMATPFPPAFAGTILYHENAVTAMVSGIFSLSFYPQLRSPPGYFSNQFSNDLEPIFAPSFRNNLFFVCIRRKKSSRPAFLKSARAFSQDTCPKRKTPAHF